MEQTLKLRWLVLGAFLSSLGTSFIWPLTSIYLHNELHQSLTTIGIVLLLYSGTNVVGSYLAGILFDRINPKKLVLVGLSVDIIVMLSLVFVNGWPVYPIMLSIVGFFNGWLTTSINSMGTLIHEYDGRYVFNMIYFAVNLGVVIGTSIVGFMYRGNVAPLFMITAILYALYIGVVVRHYHIQRVTTRSVGATKKQVMPINSANIMIMWTLFIALGIIWIMYEQWVSNMSVYIVDQGISMPMYSMLWTINAGLIVLLQIVMSWVNHHIKNIYLPVYVGVCFCAASYFVLLWAHDYTGFLIAMIVLTIGEATAFPAIPAIVNDLSPVAVKGKYQGLTNAFSSVGKALGPLFGGIIIEAGSYRLLFIICAVAVLVVNVAIFVIVKARQKHVIYYK